MLSVANQLPPPKKLLNIKTNKGEMTFSLIRK